MNARHPFYIALVVIGAVFIYGCSGPTYKSDPRYKLDQDTGPNGAFDFSEVAEPVPRYEPDSRGGNKSPYKVWGKTYYVLPSRAGYREKGVASWYGSKFHGYKTSNGETYNMYGYSAAHKSLPLPTFARVTNLENGRTVIVRINDRGPFHGARLIDLSYAAATKLGYADKGIARVEVEAIQPEFTASDPPEQKQNVNAAFFIQVGAYKDELSALKVRNHVGAILDAPVFIKNGEDRLSDAQASNESWFRVRVGPFRKELDANYIKSILDNTEYDKSLVILR